MFRRSSNPVLSRVRNEHSHSRAYAYASHTATFSGIAVKTGFLLGIVVLVSALIWMNFQTLAESGILLGLLIGSSLFGFIFILLAQFTNAKALFTTLYAASEGVIIGTLTLLVQTFFPETPIVFNAAIITFVIAGFLLVAYATGLFKVGFQFRKFVYTLLFTLVIFSFISLILSFFGIYLLTSLSPGVLLALTVGFILLASFMLLIDFDDCKRAVDAHVPKKYEWTLSLGLLVSLVWLYVEVLRLLMILASRSRD